MGRRCVQYGERVNRPQIKKAFRTPLHISVCDRPEKARFRALAGRFLLSFLILILFGVAEILAQRPIRTFDPFYLGESANRIFFDTYSITAEASYRLNSFLTSDEIADTGLSSASDPLGLNFRVEYHLSRQLDMGIYVDAVGNTAGRSLDLSWITLKYFQRYENVNYAIRLAVDPASNGGAGFPQMDLGFLYHTFHSPTVSSDYAIGIRRVQMGFQQLIKTTPQLLDEDDAIIAKPDPERQLLRSQALGWEVHLMGGYNFIFDPAGSKLYVSVMGEGGSYDLVEWVVDDLDPGGGARISRNFSGGVIWLRSGIELNRPSYLISPHISIPFKQWATSAGDDWPRSTAYLGLRLTIR